MGKRVLGGFFSCAVAIAALSGCATGSLQSPSIVTTGPASGTAGTAVTTAPPPVAASAAEQSRRTDVAASVASSRAAASKADGQLAAASSAEAAARRSAAEEYAAQRSSTGQAPPETDVQPDDTTTEEAPSSTLSEADALAHGWYDERGWVSPQTAARALAAGIPLGANVPDSLRCGTACGEDPTSGEIQAQKSAEQASVLADASAEPCAYMVVRGVCYATPSEAAAAGE